MSLLIRPCDMNLCTPRNPSAHQYGRDAGPGSYLRIIPEKDITYNFFGNELKMPIMGASIAGVNSFGGESVISEKDFCRSIVIGCKQAGTIGWRGDTYTYSLENSYGIK